MSEELLSLPELTAALGNPPTFRNAINEREKLLVRSALKLTGGSVTEAARLLGFNHHQSVVSLVKKLNLAEARTPALKRKKSIVGKRKRR